MAAQWYIIHAYSGFEGKVREQILAEAERMDLTPYVKQVEVPTEQVTEVRRGKKITRDRKFFPGYVLAKLDLNDQVYHLVRNTPRVSGFLGSSGKPQAISEKEASRILNVDTDDIALRPQSQASFEIGETVSVEDGPFASFNGLVEEVDYDKTRLKVSVSIFGRATPVELDFNQVKKVTD